MRDYSSESRLVPWFMVVGTFCALSSPLQAQDDPHPYEPGIDVIHYTFALDLPDTGTVIQGNAAVLLRRTRQVAALRLDLLDLMVSGVTLDNHPVSFTRDSATLRIPLPSAQPFSVPDTFLVHVIYHGPVSDGLIIHGRDAKTWAAFGDNWPDRARHWLPCIDHPSDKATVTWDITAPSNRTIVANGSQTLRDSVASAEGSRIRTVWECHRPLPTYVMVIAAAPLILHTLGRSTSALSEFPPGVPQTLYTFPNQSSQVLSVFDSAISIVNYFSTIVGPFPYEKLAHCQSSTVFGGMENASAIFYFDKGFTNNQITDDLIAHETAHQWFGDAVTPRSWPNLWLSEGFATYFAELWKEQSRGDSTFLASMAAMRKRVIRSSVTSTRPVLDTTETNLLLLLNSNSYQKGAWVLHMLRSLLGDQNFFRGIRQYYETFRHGTAISRDLRQSMERASGRTLGWFFDQWLRRPGFIEAALEWNFNAKARRIEFRIRQESSFLPYQFDLTLAVKHSSGKDFLQTIPIPASPETSFVIPWNRSEAPAEVVADPGVSLLATISVKRTDIGPSPK